MTQRALATVSGVHQPTIAAIETGHRGEGALGHPAALARRAQERTEVVVHTPTIARLLSAEGMRGRRIRSRPGAGPRARAGMTRSSPPSGPKAAGSTASSPPSHED